MQISATNAADFIRGIKHTYWKIVPSACRRLRWVTTPSVFFGEAVFNGGSKLGPRRCPDFQLVVVLDGKVQVIQDGREICVAAGQMGLLKPNSSEIWHFSKKSKTHTWYALIGSHLLTKDLVAVYQALPGVLSLTQRLASVMELGLSVRGMTNAPVQKMIDVLGWQLLQEYFYASKRWHEVNEPDALQRVLDWIAQTPHQAIDIPTLASKAEVSPTQLLRLFKSYLGTTPMHYVWEKRTNEGLRLLCETDLTVSDVAWRCGFRAPFHFYRWVHRISGMSPKAVRARHRRQQ